MPIYMDLHILPGVKARDVAEAHRADLLIQNDHACNCMTYWIDEKRGNVFCLIEAPDKEAVQVMHHNAHGLVPHRIIEVNDILVESFLGRISDPDEATINDEGLKVFSDSSFRILLMIRFTDPILLQHRIGRDKAGELIQMHHDIARKQLAVFGGNEVELEGPELIGSFVSAGKAVACARAIQNGLREAGLEVLGSRIAAHAGDPVTDNGKLFGETVQTAGYMCSMGRETEIVISSAVKEVIAKDHADARQNHLLALSQHDEELLISLYQKLGQHWQDPGFGVPEYCAAMAMSKSQLYRTSLAYSGLSPNSLLKDYRLEKAREMLKKESCNISEVTFDCGFTSPSYFTKCFKKKYGLLPMAYLDLLQ